MHRDTIRRADPLEPGGSIAGRTKKRGFKATVLSCANGAMTDRLSQCKKLEHGLPGLNLGIKKPHIIRTRSHLGDSGAISKPKLCHLLEVAEIGDVAAMACAASRLAPNAVSDSPLERGRVRVIDARYSVKNYRIRVVGATVSDARYGFTKRLIRFA